MRQVYEFTRLTIEIDTSGAVLLLVRSETNSKYLTWVCKLKACAIEDARKRMLKTEK